MSGAGMAPAQAHSHTSIEAAEAIEASATTLRVRVYNAIVDAGLEGMTDQELQIALGMDPSTERPRRVELVERGLVVDGRRTRATRSGRQATVWIAALVVVP